MKYRVLNIIPFIGMLIVVTLGVYYGEQAKPTYRDCVELINSSTAPLQIYEQPESGSKRKRYQPSTAKERFWVTQREPNGRWAQLYYAVTLYDALPESARLGWVNTTSIKTLGIFECISKSENG